MSDPRIALSGSLKKRVYLFSEGSLSEQRTLGVKGANLCELYRLKQNVPSGFIISAEACVEYVTQQNDSLNNLLVDECLIALRQMQKETNKCFDYSNKCCEKDQFSANDASDADVWEAKMPLLFAVRSGASHSMPGLMESALFVGMNDQIVEKMATFSQNPHWAWSTYCQFFQSYGVSVLGVEAGVYEKILREKRDVKGLQCNADMSLLDLKQVVEMFKNVVDIAYDPLEQLTKAIQVAFMSWYSPMATEYRENKSLLSALGHPVIVQRVVFGNYNSVNSGCGLLYTRCPISGEKRPYGEFQSGGSQSPVPNAGNSSSSRAYNRNNPVSLVTMREMLPEVYAQLLQCGKVLEKSYKDMQEIDFVVENGEFFILSSNSGRRSMRAAVHIAVSLVKENIVSESAALMTLKARHMGYLLHLTQAQFKLQSVDTRSPLVAKRLLATGIGATEGTVTGQLAFTTEEVLRCKKLGVRCVYCANETTAKDFAALKAADGVITVHGGLSSHAAVLMRELDEIYCSAYNAAVDGTTIGTSIGTYSSITSKVAVVGVSDLVISEVGHRVSTQNLITSLQTGDVVTIDGRNGHIYRGAVPLTTVAATDSINSDSHTVLVWANKTKRMAVEAVVSSLEEVQQAQGLGVDGVQWTDNCLRRPRGYQDPLSKSDKNKSSSAGSGGDVLNGHSATCTMVGDQSESVCEKEQQLIEPSGSPQSVAHIARTREAATTKVMGTCDQREAATTDSLLFTNLVETFNLMAGKSVKIRLPEWCGDERSAEADKAATTAATTGSEDGNDGALLSDTQTFIANVARAAVEVAKLSITVRPHILVPESQQSDLRAVISLIRNTFVDAFTCADFTTGGDDTASAADTACSGCSSTAGKSLFAHLRLQIGMVVESLRGCLQCHKGVEAQQQCSGVDFIQFDTDSLTESTFGMARGDNDVIVDGYLAKGVFCSDPLRFQLDVKVVGSMVQMAINQCTVSHPHVKVLMTGAHCGDTNSVRFFDWMAADGIACCVDRVPSAKVAAAQSNIRKTTRFVCSTDEPELHPYRCDLYWVTTGSSVQSATWTARSSEEKKQQFI